MNNNNDNNETQGVRTTGKRTGNDPSTEQWEALMKRVDELQKKYERERGWSAEHFYKVFRGELQDEVKGEGK